MNANDAIGVIGVAIGEEHLMTFMLSSPFTARNIAAEKGDLEGVKTDLNIALAMSIALAVGVGYLLHSRTTSIFGVAFGIVLFEIYKVRGGLQ